MVTERQKKQHEIIRVDVREGKSSTQIQKHLQQERLGMRRKNLLSYIRQVKGTKPKPHAYKYTRKIYKKKRAIRVRTEFERNLRQKAYETETKQKHISIYSKVDGVTRRIEATGTGKHLFSFILDAVKHPPKKRFLRTNVDRMGFGKRAEVLDLGDRWDDRPTITS
jgi:hypothetical protein